MKEIKKKDLLEAIELANDQGDYYYNKITGETIYISEDDRIIIEDCTEEDLDDYSQWQKEALEAAIDVEVNWDNYIPLPSSFDINEYDIMFEFCYSLDDNICDKLLYALKGKGAFRRFKDSIIRLNVEKKWYDFRDKAFTKIAQDWCDANGIKIKSS